MGVVRGAHYVIVSVLETKLIRCGHGRVYEYLGLGPGDDLRVLAAGSG